MPTVAEVINQAKSTIMPLLKGKLIDQRKPATPTSPNVQGGPINLNVVRDQLKQLLSPLTDAEKDQVIASFTQPARGEYNALAALIQAMNPYGVQTVMVPDLAAVNQGNLTDIKALRDNHGIEVSGWLQEAVESAAVESSDEMMSDMDEAQSFHWEFRYPDDLTTIVAGSGAPRGTDPPLQITKAVRIPFIYRHPSTGLLLLGHIVVGYEGAGSA